MAQNPTQMLQTPDRYWKETIRGEWIIIIWMVFSSFSEMLKDFNVKLTKQLMETHKRDKWQWSGLSL